MKNVSLYIDLAFYIIVLPVMAMIFPIERWYHNFPWYIFTVGVWLYAVYFFNRFKEATLVTLEKSRGAAGKFDEAVPSAS